MVESRQRQPAGRRTQPAGVTPLRYLRMWFDDGTVARVFEPLVADWQRDVATARSAADARRRWLAGLAAFVLTAARLAPRACVEDPAGTGRLVMTMLCVTVLAPSAALLGPYFRHGPAVVGGLLPQVTAFVLPVAFVPLGMRLSQWPVAADVRIRLSVRWITLACGVQALVLAGTTSSAPAAVYAASVVAPAVSATLGWRLGRQIGPTSIWRLAFWWLALATTSWVLWSASRTLGVSLEAAAVLPLCVGLLLATLLGQRKAGRSTPPATDRQVTRSRDR